MMTRLRALLTLTFVFAAVAGCGGPRLAADPPAQAIAALQGTWRLDAAASDDAAAIIAAALPRPRRERAAGEGGRPPGGAAAEMLRSFVQPAALLRVGGPPREVVLIQDGRRRAFTPGDDRPYSITDRYGTRSVQAGWERDEFVVASRSSSGLDVVERFRRGAGPDSLVTTVTLKARGLGTVRVQSTYRRTSDTVPPPSAAEGPPAPLR